MSDHDHPIAANLLDRQFAADTPNQRWLGDTTDFVMGSSGKLYLAAIVDLFSRFIVGWAVGAVNDRHLTMTALEMALKRRCPDAGLPHHSDQGLVPLRQRGSGRSRLTSVVHMLFPVSRTVIGCPAAPANVYRATCPRWVIDTGSTGSFTVSAPVRSTTS